jgi:hypothetical protein
MTVKQTLDAIHALGLTATHTDGEYRVAYRGKRAESLAYFSEDADDALATATVMAVEIKRCREPMQDDAAFARIKIEAQKTANREGVSMGLYVWDGEAGTKRYAVRHWNDGQWDDPSVVFVAHPSTIEQGG